MATGTRADRLPFLEAKDINRDGTTKVKLVGPMRVYSGQKGVSLILEVAIGSDAGVHRDWSLILGKRSFDVLQNTIGRDLSKWPGRVVEVESDPSGRFVNPVDARDAREQAPATAPAASGDKSKDSTPF